MIVNVFLISVTSEAYRNHISAGRFTKAEVREMAKSVVCGRLAKRNQWEFVLLGRSWNSLILMEYVKKLPGNIIDQWQDLSSVDMTAQFLYTRSASWLNVGSGCLNIICGQDMEKNEVYVSRSIEVMIWRKNGGHSWINQAYIKIRMYRFGCVIRGYFIWREWRRCAPFCFGARWCSHESISGNIWRRWMFWVAESWKQIDVIGKIVCSKVRNNKAWELKEELILCYNSFLTFGSQRLSTYRLAVETHRHPSSSRVVSTISVATTHTEIKYPLNWLKYLDNGTINTAIVKLLKEAGVKLQSGLRKSQLTSKPSVIQEKLRKNQPKEEPAEEVAE